MLDGDGLDPLGDGLALRGVGDGTSVRVGAAWEAVC